jgi:hypothetical protein
VHVWSAFSARESVRLSRITNKIIKRDDKPRRARGPRYRHESNTEVAFSVVFGESEVALSLVNNKGTHPSR